MEITILVDQDLLGFDIFIEQGLQETGWDQLIQFQFKRLRDYGFPDNLPDQEIWRFVQAQQLLLITNTTVKTKLRCKPRFNVKTPLRRGRS